MADHVEVGGHDRVREHTAASVNARIDDHMVESVVAATKDGYEAIVTRLGELDREWDIDRTLMAAFTVIGGTTFALGLHRYATTPLFHKRRKGLLFMFGAQLGFLAVHAIVGWAPPVPILRRLGFRTSREIELERHALRAHLA